MSNDNAFVAADPLSSGDVTLTGVGSTWTSAGYVYLGGNTSTLGGAGTTTVNTDAVMVVQNTLVVWDNYTLNIAGGTVITPVLDVRGTAGFTKSLDLTGTGTIGSLALNGGSVTAPVIDFGPKSISGFGSLNGEVVIGGDVTATGDLTLGDAASFNSVRIDGDLDVGPHTVTIQTKGFFNLGSSTVIAGGTLDASNGVGIAVGNAIAAFGAIAARIAAQSGSMIVATGDLSLGDPASTTGFDSDGDLIVSDHTVTLGDANQAVLGSLTLLGERGLSGNVEAVNGALIDFGNNLEGFGTLNTPDDPFRPVINNGSVSGDSLTEAVTLTGYVKGVGTLDNVVITGTDAPGFSVAAVYRGSVAYRGTLEIEIGGTAPGQFDRVIHSGTADLGGTIVVLPINGYVSAAGDRFTIMEAAVVSNDFDTVVTPPAPTDLFWMTTIDTASLVDTVMLSVCAREADFDMNCAFTVADFAGLPECLSGPGVTPNPPLPHTPADCLSAFDVDGDGDVDLADHAELAARGFDE